jgi:hypothetical protein
MIKKAERRKQKVEIDQRQKADNGGGKLSVIGGQWSVVR